MDALVRLVSSVVSCFSPEFSWHLLLGIILKVSIDQHIQKQETVKAMQKNKSSKLESLASQDLDENKRMLKPQDIFRKNGDILKLPRHVFCAHRF